MYDTYLQPGVFYHPWMENELCTDEGIDNHMLVIEQECNHQNTDMFGILDSIDHLDVEWVNEKVDDPITTVEYGSRIIAAPQCETSNYDYNSTNENYYLRCPQNSFVYNNKLYFFIR